MFDDRSGITEWDILVQQDPTTHMYSVVRRQDNQVIENFGDVGDGHDRGSAVRPAVSRRRCTRIAPGGTTTI